MATPDEFAGLRPRRNDNDEYVEQDVIAGWWVFTTGTKVKNILTGDTFDLSNIGSGGSSASLDVLDDGSTVLSPAEALNLDGGYFDVTDAGNGQADATLQPGNISHNALGSISKGDHRTDEQIEDLVAALISAGPAINVSYDDGNDSLQVAVPTDGIDMTQIDETIAPDWVGSHDFTNGDIHVPSPTQTTEAATKEYVDATSQGLQGKDSVVAATDGANVDLASSTDPNPIDGVTLTDGQRVLLKDQTDGTENGIYSADIATDPTTWQRTSDMDEDAEVEPGVYVFVEAGTANADTGWFITNDSVTLGTTDITWSIFARAGEISAGDYLSKSGSTLNVEPQQIPLQNLDDVTVTAMLEGQDADKPAAETAGRWYHATDTKIVYRDNGTSWVAQGGKGTSSNPVPGTQHYEAVSTEQIGSERHNAGAYDGAGPDARLDNALSAASGGDVIYLENTDYTADRTISTQVSFVGTRVSYGNDGTNFNGSLTVDGRCNFENVAFSGAVTANGKYTTFDNVPLEGGSSITVAADYVSITRATLGDVTFQSGTSNGIADACRGTSVTDNGSNTIGDIS